MAAATEEEESQGEESVGSTQQWCTNEVIVKAWSYTVFGLGRIWAWLYNGWHWVALAIPCSSD